MKLGLTSVLALALWLLAPAYGADEKFEQQITALGAARTRAEIAFHHCEELFRNDHAYYGSWGRLDDLHERIMHALHARMETEQHKPDMDRSNELIQTLDAHANALEQEFRDLQRTHETHEAQFKNAAHKFEALNQVLEELGNRMRAWIEAELDPAILQAAFEQVASGLDDARTHGEHSVAEAQQFVKQWEAKYKEVADPAPAAAAKKDGPQF